MQHKRLKSEIKNTKQFISETKFKRIKQLSSRFVTEPSPINTPQSPLAFKIQVCIRVRPINPQKQNQIKVVTVQTKTNLILQQKQKKNRRHSFNFDRVFKQNQNNWIIHQNISKSLVKSFINGFNSSIFAYGATGSGKTFTMFGNQNQMGLIQHSIKYLFQQIQSQIQNSDFLIKMSCVELYNQVLYDLMSDIIIPVQLRQSPNKGIFLAGALEVMILSQKQVFKMFKKIINRRSTQSTASNQSSSRSHAIIQLYLQKKDKAQGFYEEISYSKFSLIDLAGSQKSGTSTNQYQSKKINQSLLVLGNCIHQLCKNCQKGTRNHIPYRDSKLTRLLKDSLGGNTKTVMISTISPSMTAYDETYNTLLYASHANKIELKIHKNIKHIDKSHVSNYEKIITQLKEQNERMKQKLGRQYDIKKYEQYKINIEKGFERQGEIRRDLNELQRKIGNIQFDQFKTLYTNTKFEKMYQPKQNEEYKRYLKQKEILTQQFNQIKQQRDQIIKIIKYNSSDNKNGQFLQYINKKVLQFQLKQLNIEKIQKSKKTTALEAQKIQVNILIDQLKHRQKIISQHKNVLRQKDFKSKDQQWFYSFLDSNSIKSPGSALPKLHFKTQHIDSEPTQAINKQTQKYKQFRKRSKSIKKEMLKQEEGQNLSKNEYSEFLQKNINRYKSYGKKKL